MSTDTLAGGTVSPLTAGAATAAAPGSAPATQGKNSLGQDAFLKLLVAELRYQNPMEPMDNKEFLSQMAMLQMLQEIQAIRQDLERVLAQKQASPAAPAGGVPGGS